MNSINNLHTKYGKIQGCLMKKETLKWFCFPVNKTTNAPSIFVSTLQTHFDMYYKTSRIYLGDNLELCLWWVKSAMYLLFMPQKNTNRQTVSVKCYMQRSDLSFLWHWWNYPSTPHLITCASVCKVQISHTHWCTFITLSLFVSLFPIGSEGDEMTQICSPLNVRKFVPLASVISLGWEEESHSNQLSITPPLTSAVYRVQHFKDRHYSGTCSWRGENGC